MSISVSQWKSKRNPTPILNKVGPSAISWNILLKMDPNLTARSHIFNSSFWVTWPKFGHLATVERTGRSWGAGYAGAGAWQDPRSTGPCGAEDTCFTIRRRSAVAGLNSAARGASRAAEELGLASVVFCWKKMIKGSKTKSSFPNSRMIRANLSLFEEQITYYCCTVQYPLNLYGSLRHRTLSTLF